MAYQQPYGSAAATGSSDPYAPYYYWDASSSSWQFDYVAFYTAQGHADPHSAAAAARAQAGLAAAGPSVPVYDPAYSAAAQQQSSAYGGGPPAAPGAAGATDEETGNKRKRYVPGAKDAEGKPLAGRLKKGETRVTVVREAAGKVWEDPTLLEWDPSHKRLFIGDLGNDVSDAVLQASFARYPSFSKARVVRKKDGKSRGYGFVAFADPKDFLKAWKEMEGKYIGSRPVRIKRAQDVEVAPKLIDSKTDRQIAADARHTHELHKAKMGGAIGHDLKRPDGSSYGSKRKKL